MAAEEYLNSILNENFQLYEIIINSKIGVTPKNPLSTNIVRYAFSPLLVLGVKELDIAEPKLSKPTPNGYSNPQNFNRFNVNINSF